MLRLVSEEIDNYSIDHTSKLPDYLNELIEITKKTSESYQMISGPIEGSLLQMLVWATNAKRVLELGLFTGFSAQMMAEALPEDGELISCDIDPDTTQLAQEFFKKSSNGHKIRVELGPALETLETLDGVFDVIFIDADKEPYVEYYEAALPLLAPHGIMAIDNVLWSGRVLDDAEQNPLQRFNEHILKDTRVKHVLLPVRDGIMLVRWGE